MPIEFDDRGLRIVGCNVPGVSFYDDDGVLWHQIYLRDDNTLNVGGTIAETAGTAPAPEATGLNTAAQYIWTGAHSFMHTITAQDIVPQTADTYDLGAAGKLWRKAYISELETTMFTSNAIVVSGARQVWGHNAGVLAAHLSDAADTCDFGIAMTPGDFVEMRGYGQVEYFEVGDNVDGTIYKIGADGSGARDLDGSGANDWPAGTPFLVLGTSGDGRVEIDADGPRISIFEQGVTYDANTERVRIGNMRNLFGTGANDRWGIGIGDYAGGNYLSYNAEEADGFILKSAGGSVVMDDTGIGGYAGGVTQWHAGTDGKLYAGGGAVTIDNSGVAIAAGTGAANKIKFTIGGVSVGHIENAPDVSILEIYSDTMIQLITGANVALDASSGDIRVGKGLSVGDTGIDPAAGTIQISQPGGGDPLLIFDIGEVDKWTLGVDDSDNDTFKINSGGSLVDSSILKLNTAGNLVLTNDFYARSRPVGLQGQLGAAIIPGVVLGTEKYLDGATVLQLGWLANSRQVFGQAATVGIWTESGITANNYHHTAQGGPYVGMDGNQYLTLADAGWNEVTVYNLVAWWWVYIDDVTTSRTVIGKWNASGNQRAWHIYYSDSEKKWQFSVCKTGAAADVVAVNSSHSVTASRWTFIGAAYRPSTTIRIYVGDILDSALTVNENTTGIPDQLFNGTAELRLGATSEPAEYWHGGLGPGLTRVGSGGNLATQADAYLDYVFKSTKYKYGG